MFKLLVALVTLGFTSPALASAAKELTVYSVYDGERLAPVFKPFTDRTGISVKVVAGTSTDLQKQLEAEGSASPADVYIDKDLVFQGEASRKSLYRPFESAVLEKNIPAQFKEAGRNWFTLFYRARVIVYNRNQVSTGQLSTYQALADNQWKGKLCLRTSSSNYNQALTAALVKQIGASETLKVLNGWAANLAVDPIKGDTDLINAMAEGKCQVGIVNTYYLAPFLKKDANFPVRPFFPNQQDFGAHVNGVGVGLARHTKNVAEATLLLEYLSSKEVQGAVADGFSQYPSNSAAPVAPVLRDFFGAFKADLTPQQELSDLVDQAKELIQQSNYK